MKPLVSVIIPTYNRPALLKRAVASVVDQTYSNIEIIIVDDASRVTIPAFSSDKKTIKTLENSENRGACYSRNLGLSISRGKYVNFLDDDDLIYPEKIEKQVDLFLNSEDVRLGIVTCHTEDERSGKMKVKYNRVKGSIYSDLLDKYAVSGTETFLFRRDIVKKAGGFDEDLESSQEYDLIIRLTENYTIDFVDEILSKEFRSINQISTNFNKKIQGAKHLYAKHGDRFKEFGNLFWLKKKLKLQLLLIRFYIGKIFGEKVYRMLLRE